MRDVLERLLQRCDLEAPVMEECFVQLMGGEWSEAAQAAFLVALRAKGEGPEEVAAAARVLRRFAVPVVTRRDPVVDTCGTGGDGSHTLNISTAAALVVAACGVAVAKHGNRSVSSKCGSADVLEALGLPLDLEAEDLGALLDEEGFAFLFAPRLHPAMRAVMPVRRALGIRTVFNLLGPLANPAGVRRQVVGVYSAAVVPLVAGALAALGAERAWVLHSEDGLDELSVAAPSRVTEVVDGELAGELVVRPEELGIAPAPREAPPVKFLTGPIPLSDCFKGKAEWIMDFLPKRGRWALQDLIICPSKDKRFLAGPTRILIDDRISNIKEWEEAGGIGIHHTGNFDETMAMVKSTVAKLAQGTHITPKTGNDFKPGN